MLLRGFARPAEAELIAALRGIADAGAVPPHVTPGGHQMSVAMTNCGSVAGSPIVPAIATTATIRQAGKAVAGDAVRRF